MCACGRFGSDCAVEAARKRREVTVMCCANLPDHGVPDVLKAADAVTCKCGGEPCALDQVRWVDRPSAEALTNFQADPDVWPQPGDTIRYRTHNAEG